jgi:hypothetical protein
MRTVKHPGLESKDGELDEFPGLIVVDACSCPSDELFLNLDKALSAFGLEVVMIDYGDDCYNFLIEKRRVIKPRKKRATVK